MKQRTQIFIGLVLVVLVIVACQPATATGPELQAIASPSATVSYQNPNAEGWAEDLEALVGNIERIHPNPFFYIDEEQFRASQAEIAEDLPGMRDAEVVTAMASLVALLKDGHSFVFPLQNVTEFQLYPLRLYHFEEGYFVVDALPPYEELVGAQVVSIGGMAVDEVADLVAPTISRDSDSTVEMILPVRLMMPELLQALGVIEDVEAPDFEFQKADGDTVSLDLEVISYADYREWAVPLRADLTGYDPAFDEISFLSGLPQAKNALYLEAKDDETFWYSILEPANFLYMQYNFVQGRNSDGERLASIIEEVEILLEEQAIEKVILDLRHNPGGNNSSYAPLLSLLRNNATINQAGNLYVLIGRNTFSAAANFATEIEQETEAIFVGEPTGGSPNLYGDATTVRLPNSGLAVKISTRYWQMSSADDTREAIEPDYEARLSEAEYFAGQDPALDLILELAY